MGLFANPSTTSTLAQEASATSGASTAIAGEVAIRESAADFIAAFNRQDAKAIAQLWAEDGDYVDEAGQTYQGRAAIEQEYARFFQDHQGTQLQLTVDSIRLVGPKTAIEDGRAVLVPPPAGAPGRSSYVAIHTKQDDGRWLLASVRDSRFDVPSTYGQLQDLELLVGDWTAEHAGTRAEVTCRWNPHKSFLERRFVVTRVGQTVSSSIEIIGWDPIAQQVTSWAFLSDGSRAKGAWTALEDGWVVQNEGITPDGTTSASVDVWAPLLDGALGWRSTRRSAGGKAVPDAKHVVLKKITPADAASADAAKK